jgi:hypothetical protein
MGYQLASETVSTSAHVLTCRAEGASSSLAANYVLKETGSSQAGRNDFAYFFNLCSPMLNAASNSEGINVHQDPAQTAMIQVRLNIPHL